ncbi:MAG: hypothetical protein AAGJ28_04950 [Pseudomonadota bacterium]
MGRIKTTPNLDLAILAGTVGDALLMHAPQRAYFYFMFLFCHQALADRLRTEHGMDVEHGEGVSPKATHQIATGMRRKRDGYYDFVETDPGVIDMNATSCGRTDAAHYCNLGISSVFLRRANAYAKPETDPVAFHFRSMLEVQAGATRQLPQRINIGPDRIVDVCHGEMAAEMLDGTPAVSIGNYQEYLVRCNREMERYMRDNHTLGYHGLNACCDCYREFFNGGTRCRSPWDRDGVWRLLTSAVAAECNALGLDQTRYLSLHADPTGAASMELV